ncbi:MAG: phosphoesterase PA-phosphatase, partial [Ginsengibacter sp.]
MKRNAGFYSLFVVFCVVVIFSSCKQKNKDYAKIMHNPDLYCDVMHKLNYVIIYDIFTPPVASRIFAYSNLAAYEVLAQEGGHYKSLQRKVNGLENIPAPPKATKIDYP